MNNKDAVDWEALEQAVTLDADRMGGAPVFAGTRVPIDNLYDHLCGGDYSIDTFHEAFYWVNKEHLKTVLEASGILIREELIKRRSG